MQCSGQNVTINKPTPSFSQATRPSCRPTNSVNAIKGKQSRNKGIMELTQVQLEKMAIKWCMLRV